MCVAFMCKINLLSITDGILFSVSERHAKCDVMEVSGFATLSDSIFQHEVACST